MDRNLALEFVRVTEMAALSSSVLMGRGDEKAADQAAVDSMRMGFDSIKMNGRVVIGEGERDEAPMLYIGEEVGTRLKGDPQIDIALDPLEGTTICATGGPGALSVIAVADKGNFLYAPDTYMDKIAVGPKAKGVVSLEKTPTENIKVVAKALNKMVSETTVVILDRPRHEALIREVRGTGARIRLIDDGDISVALATAWDDSGIDMVMGIGGAPEGVITAAALKCLGGDFEGKLCWRSDEEKARALEMGVTDPDKIYKRDELAKGNVMFIATGVTDGPLLKGVRILPEGRALTESVVMRSATETVRRIQATHNLEKKPEARRPKGL
ncbi:MAG: class II fructose-bisphosphatase [Bdellovibrionales bacterium]